MVTSMRETNLIFFQQPAFQCVSVSQEVGAVYHFPAKIVSEEKKRQQAIIS